MAQRGADRFAIPGPPLAITVPAEGIANWRASTA